MIGNRMDRDDAGREWPSNVRSLSMGDVIVIGEQAWDAVAIGWNPVDVGDLLRSLDPGQAIRHPQIDLART